MPEPVIEVWFSDEEGGASVTRLEVGAAEYWFQPDWAVIFFMPVEAPMFAMLKAKLPSEIRGSLVGLADAAAREIHPVEALPPPTVLARSVSSS